MFKFITIKIVITVCVISSARKNHQKFLPQVIEELKGRATDDNLEGISVEKQLFQDVLSERQIDNILQFGYVCENPLQWEQRFEEKDFMGNRHRGKVKWGNADGTYGEQYWDINHK